MARPLPFLLLFLVFLRQLSTLAQNETQFFYNTFLGSNLQLDGNAAILPSGILRLTNTSQQLTGHAFHPFPLKFSSYEHRSFSTNFVVAIVHPFESVGGHGMAFVISPSMDFSKAVANSNLGLFNISNNQNSSNHIVAVELDTVRSPEFEDINDNHVGVDVNSLISIASAPVSYYNSNGKNESFNLTSGQPIHVWIDYDDETEKLLHVSLAQINKPKPTLPLLSTPIDLSLILLDSMYVGFSAATGTLTSDHYVLGWSFNKSGQSQPLDISKLPKLPPQTKKPKNGSVTPMVVSIVVPLLSITIAGMVVAYIVRRNRYKETREPWEKDYGPHRFSYKRLYKATKGFSDKEILGSGGFGNVYRGLLPSSNEQIAVKKIANCSEQGLQEFVAEIVSMGRLKHRNLVQLYGYCRRKGQLLLVYDYMPNGSVDMFLFTNEKKSLSWFYRFKILKDVASALVYLHEEWEQVVLHRDVKASNVMLDADMNGRLGDFGLAKFYDRGANPDSTRVVGTVGYIAPELSRTGIVTTSTDVFSFGAFTLEMACGRKPIEVRGLAEEVVLVDWVSRSFRRGAILETSDPGLDGDYEVEEMELVLKMGLLCSHSDPAVRPSMRQVMHYLSGDASLPEIPIDSATTIPASFSSIIDVTSDMITTYDDTSSEHSLYGH